MNMIEKLTDRERDAIANYIDRNAGNCDGISCSIEHLLRFWDKEKTVFKLAFLKTAFSVWGEPCALLLNALRRCCPAI